MIESRLSLLAALLFACVFSVLFYISEPASAAVGGAGSGGGSGGGGTQYLTKYGHGWYQYDVNSSQGPEYFIGGKTNWGDVQKACKSDDADKVAMFIVVGGGKQPPTGVMVYDDFYGTAPHYYQNYKDKNNSGAPWMNRDTVKNLYDNLPPNQKQGYSFGYNVAWFCYSETLKWTMDSGSYIKIIDSSNSGVDTGWKTAKQTAKPGDKLGFKHTLVARNADVDKKINWTLRGSGFPGSFGGSALESGAKSPKVPKNSYVVRLGNFPGGSSGHTVYTVTQGDVGKELCQRLEWRPTAWNNNGSSATPYRCATVPYDYTLVPRITVPGSDQVIEADRVTTPVRGTITATGPTKSHTNLQWRFTKVEYPANLTTIPKKSGGNRISSADPCAFFTSETSCSTVRSGVDTSGINHLASETYAADALMEPRDVGTKICFALSVKRNSSSSTDWRHSDLQCFIIGKTPKAQVHGGNLSVGRGFPGQSADHSSRVDVSLTNLQGVPKGSGYEARTFGSWAEYGVLAPGEIKWMASASGLNGGNTSNKQPSWSNLSFAHANKNSPCMYVYGCYISAKQTLPDIAALFPVDRAQSLGSSTSVGISEMVSKVDGSHTLTTSQPTVVITGGTLVSGNWVVLNAPNTHVIITGNIQYSNGPFTHTSQIPQLVINARDITIASGVSRVDSWLIARNALSTCDQRGNATQLKTGTYYQSTAARLSANECSRRLTVNGPAMANQLYLRRTAGSERATVNNPTRPGNPAEIFNLRPDAYLWMQGVGRQSVYRTTGIQELPPRY